MYKAVTVENSTSRLYERTIISVSLVALHTHTHTHTNIHAQKNNECTCTHTHTQRVSPVVLHTHTHTHTCDIENCTRKSSKSKWLGHFLQCVYQLLAFLRAWLGPRQRQVCRHSFAICSTTYINSSGWMTKWTLKLLNDLCVSIYTEYAAETNPPQCL